MDATNIDYEDEDIRRAHTNVEARKACFETCKRKNHASAALGHQWDENHVPHWKCQCRNHTTASGGSRCFAKCDNQDQSCLISVRSKGVSGAKSRT